MRIGGLEEEVVITKQSVDELEEPPRIIKKLHKRQISSASAKMFALADDIFCDGKPEPGRYQEDLPKMPIERSSNEISKEVHFGSKISDDLVSKSAIRSDFEGTVDTQLTTLTNPNSTGIGTAGTSTSGLSREKSKRYEINLLTGK